MDSIDPHSNDCRYRNYIRIFENLRTKTSILIDNIKSVRFYNKIELYFNAECPLVREVKRSH